MSKTNIPMHRFISVNSKIKWLNYMMISVSLFYKFLDLFIKVLHSTKLTLNKNIRHEYAIDITDSKIKEMHIELLFVTIALLVITVACYFQIGLI